MVVDGLVDMHDRLEGAEHIARLGPNDILVASTEDQHVADGVGAARILVSEEKGSV